VCIFSAITFAHTERHKSTVIPAKGVSGTLLNTKKDSGQAEMIN
jgi:hypothetical protein